MKRLQIEQVKREIVSLKGVDLEQARKAIQQHYAPEVWQEIEPIYQKLKLDNKDGNK